MHDPHQDFRTRVFCHVADVRQPDPVAASLRDADEFSKASLGKILPLGDADETESATTSAVGTRASATSSSATATSRRWPSTSTPRRSIGLLRGRMGKPSLAVSKAECLRAPGATGSASAVYVRIRSCVSTANPSVNDGPGALLRSVNPFVCGPVAPSGFWER